MRTLKRATFRRRDVLICGMALMLMASSAWGNLPDAEKPGDWASYGRDTASTKYSPLDQIRGETLTQLKFAWEWDSPDNAFIRRQRNRGHKVDIGPNEGTPLYVDGRLYVPTGLNRVCAIDPKTGRNLWVYEHPVTGSVHRGLAYWKNGNHRRLFLAARDARLVALDPDTGKPIRSFGRNGSVDLTEGLRRKPDRKLVSNTSPPMVCGDVVVVGGSVDDFQETREMPPGDVRGFDARTGRQLWRFHTVPQRGEFGNNTWKNNSWKYTGSTNVWTMMSYDPELDLVYLPVSTPNNDWYGGHRPGAGLFGESLVCLEAKTGKRRWHFQMVHHGLWDYDLPCAPVLLDVTQNGKRIKAVAQVTKQAFCFVFDRVTGRPLWPIRERPVPPTTVPGDKAWPTQPFPTKPLPFDRQGLVDRDIIDFTPELKAEAKTILKDWVHGPLYTPPARKKTILMPGWVGGASWAGAAADPETGMLYVPSITNAMWLQLEKPKSPNATVRYKIGANGYQIDGPRGLPLTKPPYGRITAIDLNTGEHRWMTPLGEGPRDHPALKDLNLPPLGLHRRGYLVVTPHVVLAVQEGSWFSTEKKPRHKPMLRAFDKATGQQLAELELPPDCHATGAPITYLHEGKQYFAIPVGGGVLPARMVAMRVP